MKKWKSFLRSQRNCRTHPHPGMEIYLYFSSFFIRLWAEKTEKLLFPFSRSYGEKDLFRNIYNLKEPNWVIIHLNSI